MKRNSLNLTSRDTVCYVSREDEILEGLVLKAFENKAVILPAKREDAITVGDYKVGEPTIIDCSRVVPGEISGMTTRLTQGEYKKIALAMASAFAEQADAAAMIRAIVGKAFGNDQEAKKIIADACDEMALWEAPKCRAGKIATADFGDALGSEINKVRPCLVLRDLGRHLVCVPLTHTKEWANGGSLGLYSGAGCRFEDGIDGAASTFNTVSISKDCVIKESEEAIDPDAFSIILVEAICFMWFLNIKNVWKPLVRDIVTRASKDGCFSKNIAILREAMEKLS